MIEFLKKGKVGIIPCDTIYGIVGLAPDTDNTIRIIKGRAEDKPFLRLINSKDITNFSNTIIPDKLLSLWPGPFTYIVNLISPEKIPSSVGTIEYNTSAIRYPKDDFLQAILKGLDSSIYSTSVNFAGQEALNNIDDIIKNFSDKVDFIVDGGDITKAIPSAIIDLSKDKPIILRSGEKDLSSYLE